MKKLRALLKNIADCSLLVGLVSLIWILLRTGTKPSRAVYPCQQIARRNLAIFGIPGIIAFWQRFKKCPRFRKKTVIAFTLISLVAAGTLKIIDFRKRQALEFLSLAGEVSGQSGSRVVWISDPRATTSSSYNPRNGNQAIVDQMLDQAVMRLTDTGSVREAWQKILPCGVNCNGRKIVVKVNYNNDWDCENNGCPVYQVSKALARQLIASGISQENINFYDSSRSIPNYFSSGVGGDYPRVQFNQYGDQGSSFSVRGAPIGRDLTEADYLINMPLLRTHGMAGVTLSFKNHLGSTTRPDAFHGAFFGGSASSNSLVQLNIHPQIRDKTILIIDDALYGLTRGGPADRPNVNPNSLFLAYDPVAIDWVMIDYLESLGAYTGGDGGDARTYLRVAAQNGLGSYSNIELIRCENGSCGGTPPSATPTSRPSPTPTRRPSTTPSPTNGDLNHDGRVDIADLVIVGANFGTSNSQADANGDGMVNISDLVIVGSNFGR